MATEYNLSQVLLIALAGLVVGSFSTVLATRIPAGKPWMLRRSQCDQCQANLKLLDLIPVLSWLLQKGCCRYCGGRIGIRYPLIESNVMVACMGIYAAWGWSAPSFALMAMVPFLAALLVIDLEHYILPDILIAISAVIGVAFVFFAGAPEGSDALLLGAGSALLYGVFAWLMGLLMTFVMKRPALGLGDVKFFSLAGLCLGFSYFPEYLIFSGLLGVIGGAYWQFVTKKQVFPFGPALIAAFYACLLLQGAGFDLF